MNIELDPKTHTNQQAQLQELFKDGNVKLADDALDNVAGGAGLSWAKVTCLKCGNVDTYDITSYFYLLQSGSTLPCTKCSNDKEYLLEIG